MNGIIGTKIGMTSIYGADGRFIACTVVEVSPNVVTQVKTEDTDGYSALQFSCIEAKAKMPIKRLRVTLTMQIQRLRKIVLNSEIVP